MRTTAAVVSAGGGLAEQVLDGETGYVVAADDVSGLAERLGRLADDAPLAARLGEAGRVRALAHFTEARVVDRPARRLRARRRDARGRARGRVVRAGPGTAIALAALGGAIAVLGAAAWLHVSGRLPAYALFGDARSMAELPYYAGWMSDAGVLLWWSGASVLGFAALASAARDPALARWLGAGAALTALLALDDVLLLHERAIPELTGLPQVGTYAVYAGLTLTWLWRWRRRHLDGERALLVAALALFATSVALDALPRGLRPWGEAHALVEDGAKWLGIVAWTLWGWRTAFAAVARAARGTTRAR